ncbi:hypothetical protein HHI36_014209 [Cryptolaemus montrouzieri]|uniref:Ionotropic receptor n=1 Tax=Cryptolaemus montrouzieri TaxID=559131 RepID=A0ABD2N2I5_9CUCU
MIVPTTNLSMYYFIHCIDTLIKLFVGNQNITYVLLIGEYKTEYQVMRIQTFEQDYMYSDVSWKYPLQPDAFIVDLDVISLAEYINETTTTRLYVPLNLHVFIKKNISPEIIERIRIPNVLLVDPESLEISMYVGYKKKPMGELLKIPECPGFLEATEKPNFSGNEFFDRISYGRIRLCYPSYCPSCNKKIERDIFEIIWNHFNITPEYYGYSEDIFVIYENFSNCDIFYGYEQVSDVPAVTMAGPYIYEKLSWFIPYKSVSKTYYPLKMFSLDSWTWWISTCIVLSVSLFFARKIFDENICISNVLGNFLMIVADIKEHGMTIALPLAYWPYPLMCTISENVLDLETGRVYLNDYTTFHEFVETEFERVYKLKNCENPLACWKLVVDDDNTAILISDVDANDYRYSHIIEHQTHLPQQLKPAYFSVRIAAFGQGGHTFFSTFNKYLSYLMEHGFIIHLTSVDFEKGTDEARREIKLNLTHMWGLFGLWLIGVVSSVCILLVEKFIVKST